MSELPDTTIVYIPNNPTCHSAQNSYHNKIKLRSFKSSEQFPDKKKMDHTAVSATQASSLTLLNWQNGANENDYNFASSHRVVDTNIN